MKSLVIASVLVLTPFVSSHATLLMNGSFEQPVIGDGTFSIFATIPGWTSTTPSGIEVQRNVVGAPFDGFQHIELDSTGNSNAFQDVPTSIGSQYQLSLAYSPRPGVSAASNPVEVWFDGALLQTLTGVGGPATAWSVHNYMVTATGTTSRLEFRAVGTSDSLGGYLDAVSLTPKNVPDCGSTFLLLLLTLPGLGLMRRLAE